MEISHPEKEESKLGPVLFHTKIPGRPMVKKNGQRTIGHGKNTRRVDTSQYRKWKASAIPYVRAARKGRMTIHRNVSLEVHFHFENRMAEADLSNLYEGIQDVLVSEGVLADDRLILSHDGSRKHFGKSKAHTEVVLREFFDE